MNLILITIGWMILSVLALILSITMEFDVTTTFYILLIVTLNLSMIVGLSLSYASNYKMFENNDKFFNLLKTLKDEFTKCYIKDRIDDKDLNIRIAKTDFMKLSNEKKREYVKSNFDDKDVHVIFEHKGIYDKECGELYEYNDEYITLSVYRFPINRLIDIKYENIIEINEVPKVNYTCEPLNIKTTETDLPIKTK